MTRDDKCFALSFGVSAVLAVVFLIAAALYARPVQADAGYMHAATGRTQFAPTALGSGTWHQSPEYGAAFFSDSPARQLILGKPVYKWLSVEGGLYDFGTSGIYGKWTTDDEYQKGHIGQENFDTGYTAVRVRAYSAGVRLSLDVGVEVFTRLHLARMRWDFDGYFTSGSDPHGTSIGAWHCNVRSTEALTSVGIKYHRFEISTTQFGIKQARESDSCTSNMTGGRTVFVGYTVTF